MALPIKVKCPFPYCLITNCLHFRLNWYTTTFQNTTIFIRWIGYFLSKINGLGKLESYNAIASAIVGQSEVLLQSKQLAQIPKHRLYTLCASAMSTVSMSIVGAYMTMIEPKYVVTALVLNLFSGFIIVLIINPYDVKDDEDILEIKGEKQSFLKCLENTF